MNQFLFTFSTFSTFSIKKNIFWDSEVGESNLFMRSDCRGGVRRKRYCHPHAYT